MSVPLPSTEKHTRHEAATLPYFTLAVLQSETLSEYETEATMFRQGLARWMLVTGLWMVGAVGGGLAQDGYPPVEQLTVNVINVYPHDTTAFTQGLLVGDDGLLYESTGRYGASSLRSVEVETGAVLRRYDLPETFFAEGLALVEDRLYQITWREQTAIVYELATGAEANTFEPLGTYQYGGEGWGLCYDGDSLYMSDGSNTISRRDPETFQVMATYRVTLHGAFIDQINELACVGDDIYANLWQSDTIIRFDKSDGAVNAVIDARGLISPDERAAFGSGAVLNGIAYNPESETFYITGKLWDRLFEVTFEPVG